MNYAPARVTQCHDFKNSAIQQIKQTIFEGSKHSTNRTLNNWTIPNIQQFKDLDSGPDKTNQNHLLESICCFELMTILQTLNCLCLKSSLFELLVFCICFEFMSVVVSFSFFSFFVIVLRRLPFQTKHGRGRLLRAES